MTERTEPSIGRVLLFWLDPDKQGQPYAATVALINDDQTVNLGYLDENGDPCSAKCVPLIQGDDSKPGDNKQYCQWMVYQVKQHAKHKAEDDSKEESSDYQTRAIKELGELNVKMISLSVFSRKVAFSLLPEIERCAMLSQLAFMKGYSEVLEERVSRFLGEDKPMPTDGTWTPMAKKGKADIRPYIPGESADGIADGSLLVDGDYIGRNQKDHSDIYRISKYFFDGNY